MVPLNTGALAVSGLGISVPNVSDPCGALAPMSEAVPGWFRADDELPGRGFRRLPTASKYLLVAANRAVGDAGERWSATGTDRRGAVVATNNAGAALLEDVDTTIIEQGSEELSPSLSPYIAMSLFASRLSMEQGITGFNLTVNSPVTAGLEAIQIATRALAAGRASTVLVGAVEEALSAAQSAGRPSQAGAAVLYCEPAGTGSARYGTCGVRSAFLDPAAAADADAVLTRLLGDTPPGRIDAVLEDSAVGTAAARWLDRLPGEREVVVVPIPALAGCLTPLQRVLGLLAEAHDAPTRRAVLAVSAQGTIALAELTVTPRPDSAAADATGGH